MDQIKIGAFIAERRKSQNLTQAALGEKLGITDRAVSKWERGKGLPDASLMLPLCEILGITVNDLLCGEVVTMDNYNKELENNLLEMVRQKEESDKKMLRTEIVLGIATVIPCLTIIGIAANESILMADWLRYTLIAVGLISFLAAALYGVKIEQSAGYYECQKCGHRYVPAYSSVLWAMHYNRTRYMRCPKCNEKSWQKKVVSNEREEK